jgi:uncharacterized protein (DUF427 family)
MSDYPKSIVETGHVAPVPRRVRGFKDGRVAFDTVRALYVWEWPNYPQYYVPLQDVDATLLGRLEHRVQDHGPAAGTVRFAWDALDAWFEEDEEVFVHPRNPYARVDAIRSSRSVRIERDGVLLAASRAPVMVFETGLPTRYYVERTAIDFSCLVPSDTETACPYKGRTSGYWSVRVGDALLADLAWSYDFPTASLLPIAGLVAFYNEHVDITVDGRREERPQTHFSTRQG